MDFRDYFYYEYTDKTHSLSGNNDNHNMVYVCSCSLHALRVVAKFFMLEYEDYRYDKMVVVVPKRKLRKYESSLKNCGHQQSSGSDSSSPIHFITYDAYLSDHVLHFQKQQHDDGGNTFYFFLRFDFFLSQSLTCNKMVYPKISKMLYYIMKRKIFMDKVANKNHVLFHTKSLFSYRRRGCSFFYSPSQLERCRSLEFFLFRKSTDIIYSNTSLYQTLKQNNNYILDLARRGDDVHFSEVFFFHNNNGTAAATETTTSMSESFFNVCAHHVVHYDAHLFANSRHRTIYEVAAGTTEYYEELKTKNNYFSAWRDKHNKQSNAGATAAAICVLNQKCSSDTSDLCYVTYDDMLSADSDKFKAKNHVRRYLQQRQPQHHYIQIILSPTFDESRYAKIVSKLGKLFKEEMRCAVLYVNEEERRLMHNMRKNLNTDDFLLMRGSCYEEALRRAQQQKSFDMLVRSFCTSDMHVWKRIYKMVVIDTNSGDSSKKTETVST